MDSGHILITVLEKSNVPKSLLNRVLKQDLIESCREHKKLISHQESNLFNTQRGKFIQIPVSYLCMEK